MGIWESTETIEKVDGWEKLNTVVVHPDSAEYRAMIAQGYKEVSKDPLHGATNGQVVLGVDKEEHDKWIERLGRESQKYLVARQPSESGGSEEQITLEKPMPISAAVEAATNVVDGDDGQDGGDKI